MTPRPSPSPESAAEALPGDPDGEPLLDIGAGVPLVTPAGATSPDCAGSTASVAIADDALANRYTLGTWPTATLPHDLAWTEDPYHDANWRFRLHSLPFVVDLLAAGRTTSNAAYTDRAVELVKDWIHDNPRVGAPADMAWNDHSTALRAIVLSCVADVLGMPDWLEASLRLHGETLADPAFYVQHGNHALNQSIGLLEVARVLGQHDWMDLAVQRIAALVNESIDDEGVTVEQSAMYETYNWIRYSVAEQRLEALGIPRPAAFARVDLMPQFIAYSALPWGHYELLGDTSEASVPAIPDTWAEYTATAGASGPKPPSLIRRFRAGFLFARSGWGTTRRFEDETALSIRYGPPRYIHGHDDGLSLTLAAWGARILVDPGLYAYGGGAFRGWITGRTAHNVVTVDKVRWKPSPTQLVGTATTSRMLDVRLRTLGNPGVVHDRRITWSRLLDYLVVEDRLHSTTIHTYRQLWHLAPGANPVLGTRTARTRQARGNVVISQLTGAIVQRVVTGSRSPIQGWTSFEYGSLRPAPVVEVTQQGRDVRYVTLIVPAAGRPMPEVLAFTTTPWGYQLTIRIGTRTETVVVNGSEAAITSGSGHRVPRP